MRKVKFTQDSFDEKLSAILEEFPMLDVRRSAVLFKHTRLNTFENRIFTLSFPH